MTAPARRAAVRRGAGRPTRGRPPRHRPSGAAVLAAAMAVALAVPLLAPPLLPTAGAVPVPVPAPAALPLATADATVAGPHAVTRLEYDAGPVVVRSDAGFSYPEERRGSLHVPAATATGPRPVVVLLHGRHGTCEVVPTGTEVIGHPCPETPATTSVRSWDGYRWLGESLASHGYVVLSVSANAINTYDIYDGGASERAQLLSASLDLLTAWSSAAGPAPVGTTLVGRLDLTRIGVMGHSRGGEGVTRFITHNAARTEGPRYPLSAVVALAPTDFGDHAPTGVPYALLLPLCDGDVADLQGARAYDRGRFAAPRAPRVQWTVAGANHNWFNTVWTQDDSGGTADTACSRTSAVSQRLSAADQQRVGLALMGAFLRRHVGGEVAFAPQLAGAEALPPAACPTGAAPCGRLVGTSALDPAARVVWLPTGTGAATTAGAVTVTGPASLVACDPGPADADAGCPTDPTRSAARQATLGWDGPGSVVRLPLAPVAGATALALRGAVEHADSRNPAGQQRDLELVLVDGAGRSASVLASAWSAALVPPAGTTGREVTLNGIRVPLSAFPGVDLADLAALELRPVGARGAVRLAELVLTR